MVSDITIMLRPPGDLAADIDTYREHAGNPYRAHACYDLLRLGLALHTVASTVEAGTAQHAWFLQLYASAGVVLTTLPTAGGPNDV